MVAHVCLEVVLLYHEDSQGDNEGQDKQGQGDCQELLPVGSPGKRGLGKREAFEAPFTLCTNQGRRGKFTMWL